MVKFNLTDALLIISGTILVLNNHIYIGGFMIFLVIITRY